MKRYKLLKDLPTFNKGDTFRLTEHGHLMSEKDGIVAYAEPTLEKFNILDSDWFEEIPEEYERGRAKKGEDTMKRYKLLKDLAGLEAGSTLYLNELGNLVAEDKTTIVFLANFIHHYNLLDSDWLGELPDERKRWRAKKGGQYWCVQSDGGVVYDHEIEVDVDDERYEIGNYFKTEEEAQRTAEWIKAFAILRDDTKGFKANWKDGGQLRWGVEYNYDTNRLSVYLTFGVQDGVIYFATREDAEESIEAHERQWRTFFNCGAED